LKALLDLEKTNAHRKQDQLVNNYYPKCLSEYTVTVVIFILLGCATSRTATKTGNSGIQSLPGMACFV
jgi:hypothetical protein